MVGFLLVVAFVLFCVAAVCVHVARGVTRTAPTERLHTELLSADQFVGDEYRQAKRAMNDAAGQSWRNLAD